MKTYELQANHDRRKSFYKKAFVTISDDGTKFLTSYETTVAAISPDGKLKRLWDGWSATTARHIDEFARQEGLQAIGKSKWLEIPVEN